MVHQPSGGYQGQVTDGNSNNEIRKQNKDLMKYIQNILEKIEEISSIMERDKYFSPDEAIKFGLIDKVVESRK